MPPPPTPPDDTLEFIPDLQMVKAHNELNADWDLDVAFIFGNMDSFIRRNFDLIEICEAMITFGRMAETAIEKPSLVGTKGVDFDRIIDNVESQFKIALFEVAKVRHHILDVLEPEWQHEMLMYVKKSFHSLLTVFIIQIPRRAESLGTFASEFVKYDHARS